MNDKLKMQTPNKAEENFRKLATMFPNAVTETKDENGEVVRAIDKDVLMQEISCKVAEGKDERYQFTWPDKKKSVLLANAPINKTLRPCREESVDFDTTENLYIEGDNLEVLKILQETYLGKIKMIYIDPPYNTGNDFVYEDDFNQDTNFYKQNSGQIDEDGNRLFQNTESNGRFHTDWLNMIYPRLKLAKDLLTDDGVIFISIGEHEVGNLKKICDEIFGVKNFIENYVWESTFRPDNSSDTMRRNAEYVMCYAKNIKSILFLIGERKTKEGLPSLTKTSMKESVLTFPADTVKTSLKDGKYLAGKRESYMLLDDVYVKAGRIANKFSLKGRVIWSQGNLEKELANGTEIIIKGEGFVPYTKKPGESVMAPAKLIPNTIVGDVLSANAEFAKLFDKKVFSYPKPVSLLAYLINYLDDNNFIAVDFFSGSATLAHAMMQVNANDVGVGRRKFILVQLPENLDENLLKASDKEKVVIRNAIEMCDENHFDHTICSIAKERIRRAGKKIKDENPLTTQNLDTGFRVLKCDSSNMKDVYYNPSELSADALFDYANNIKEDRSPEDLLFQVMLDLGVLPSSKIVETTLGGKKVFSVADGFLMACFDEKVSEETIIAIAKQKPYYFVMRDSSMANDSVATNFDQIFATYSPDTVRKVL